MSFTERSKRSSFSAFTLIELLVVIAIIAILAVVVVLTLNPAQLLAQSRDSNRVSDMATLNTAIGIYQTDSGGIGAMGNPAVVYVSLPDATLSGNTTSTCTSLSLSALPAGYQYQCASPQSLHDTDNTGWLPVNFQQISSGAPFGSLPADPTNSSSTGLHYTYIASGTSYMVSAIPESQKQKLSLAQKPMIPNYPDVIANGSNLSISPLYNPSGLVGYWNFDEGNGSTTQDLSGNGNPGTWSGTPTGANGTYYTAGRVGSYAGIFDGVADVVLTGTNNLPLGNNPRSVFMWIYPTTFNVQAVTHSYGTYSGYQYAALWTVGAGPFTNVEFGDNAEGFAIGPYAITIPNAWYFIGYSYSAGASNTVSVYINGQGTTTSFPSALATVLGSAGIGSGVGYGHQFPGSIDDVRVYNRALSAAEVKAIYNAER